MYVIHDDGHDVIVVPMADAPPLELPRGVAVDVPDDVAGREPFWRRATPGDDLAWFPTRIVEEAGAHVVEVLDPGAGLLAQVPLFRPATDAEIDAARAAEEG